MVVARPGFAPVPMVAPGPMIYPAPVLVRPKVYVLGQPVRNVVRAVLP